MKAIHILAAGAVALSLAAVPNFAPTQAQAIGCLSGGAAGAVAGHYAGHHAILGAVGGCIAGHHMHKVQQQRRAAAHDATMSPSSTSTPGAAPTPGSTPN